MGLSKKDEEVVFKLAEKLTGTCQAGAYRKEIFLGNVERRMQAVGTPSLGDYLRLVRDNSDERDQLISGLTIHTTSWFREKPHFDSVRSHFRKVRADLLKGPRPFKIWSAACSTGEEVYSFALCLADQREDPSLFEIHGSDLDALSVRRAGRAIYPARDMREIPELYRPHLLLGHGNVEGFFTIDKEIRDRCRFFVNDLSESDYLEADSDYDVIICRNVLIYFRPEDQRRIVARLAGRLRTGGLLVLGHSETPDMRGLAMTDEGHSTFLKLADKPSLGVVGARRGKPKLLVVDDSPTVRHALVKMATARFEVVTCDSAEAATREVHQSEFDLVSLDLNMPGENGLNWLTRMRAEGFATPVVILSESDPSSAARLFGGGAVHAQDYLTKRDLQQDPDGVMEIFASLTERANSDLAIEVRTFFAPSFRPRVIAIGASTGGPEAISRLLANFPKPCPPVVIVQHIAAEFCKAFGQRLSAISGLAFLEWGVETDLLKNHIYLTTRDAHLQVKVHGDSVVALEVDGASELGHRPSVNSLFRSLARAGVDSLAVLLTGMGEDGADGMAELAEGKRCYTMAQDQKSSVVFGMNRKAIEAKAVCFVGSPESLRSELIKKMKGWS